jgi:hypothetical protein
MAERFTVRQSGGGEVHLPGVDRKPRIGADTIRTRLPSKAPSADTNMINKALTIFVRSRETALRYRAAMDAPFIASRLALSDAADLMARYGEGAAFEAASRAEQSRDNGNVVRFCHWRQIERVIATLSSDEVFGSVH